MSTILLKFEEPPTSLHEYAQVPSIFTIPSILEVREFPGGFALEERPISHAREKNYDDFEAPPKWAEQFNLSHWCMISAFTDGGERAGGCIVAYDTDGLDMLEGRQDITVLWDIRVAPAYRRRGIATRLFTAALEWSRERRCIGMKIETQNNNVAACRFYAAQGCFLVAVNPFVYREFPDETQLIWYKPIR